MPTTILKEICFDSSQNMEAGIDVVSKESLCVYVGVEVIVFEDKSSPDQTRAG